MTLTAQPRTGTPPAAPTHPPIGSIAPGDPVYLVAVNPWLPWCNRAAGAALGACLATAAAVLLGSPLVWWAIATTVAMALLFAWVVAGHELHARLPKTFKAAP